MFILLLIFAVNVDAAIGTNEEILPDPCDCRDWYGACRTNGEQWTDENVWMYICNSKTGKDGTFVGCEGTMGEKTHAKSNQTVAEFWHACDQDNVRLRYEEGCYYKNETQHDVLLKIGETGYNGLIKHVCDRFVDYPGRVQYYAEVRDDVPVKHPTNKGINKNFPEARNTQIQGKVNRWLHENAAEFVANGDEFKAKIRYLPASRTSWG
ncbi:unnamed protein product, partial [Mesorhabditis spiculigera]